MLKYFRHSVFLQNVISQIIIAPIKDTTVKTPEIFATVFPLQEEFFLFFPHQQEILRNFGLQLRMVKANPYIFFLCFVKSKEVEVGNYSDDILTRHASKMKSSMEILMIMHKELALVTAAFSLRRTGVSLLFAK